MFNFLKSGIRKESVKSDVLRDASRGQITSVDPDKLNFDKYVYARNVKVNEADWEVRNGIQKLADILITGAPADYYAFDIYKKETGNDLVVVMDDDANAGKVEIQKIDRTTGSKTSLYANITGTGAGCLASQNNFLHYVNNENTVKIYSSAGTSTVALPVGGTKAKLSVSDGSRIWVSTDEGVVRFSDAQEISIITTFAPAGSDLDRAGIATSDIVECTALKSVSGFVLISGKNESEIHACPNFRNDQVTTFPDNFPTLKYSFKGIGCDSNFGAVATPLGFFIKPTYDDYIHLLPVGGQPKAFRDNSGRMSQLSFENCKLVYDSRENYIYIQAKEKFSQAVVVVVFDIVRQVFFEYNGFYPVLWASDSDNTYFIDRANDVQDAFVDGVFNDNGQDINFEIRSADDFAGSMVYYKKASRMNLDIEYWGLTTLSFQIWESIRPGGGGGQMIYSKGYELSNNASPLTESPQYFGLGVPGNTGFNFESETHLHLYDINTLVNRLFFRASMILSGSTSSRFRARGVGVLYEPTNKHARVIIT